MSIQQTLDIQRSKFSLPVTLFSEFLYGKQFYHQMKQYLDFGQAYSHNPNIYNQTRLQLIKDSYRYLPLIYNSNVKRAKPEHHSHLRSIYTVLSTPHQLPASAHFGMFVKYIDLMGSDEHKRKYLQKSIKCQIVGCYAQTQLGHGSDIRSLQTTATFDEKTQQWILNSPTVSSAKYWPGELSFIANYAIIFAQTIIKGKNHGVNPFLVQIKDKDYNWMPNIEGGDIGSKIGYHAKENGFMYLRNVRIPKDDLLNKYTQVSKTGQLKQIGDPRVGYGTMMHIRQLISCVIPKYYTQVIIIAARYAFFRKQFKGADKKQTPIIEYQLQQQKIIPRIAQYYAITVAGNKIRKVSEQNTANIQKNDFSLLQENHSNLAFSKCLFSQIIQDGIEVLRRSLGGHGTSLYSGVPQIMNEYTANNTHEGQNTVMYLQTARYVLKNYLSFLTKGKKLPDSVAYISKFNDLSNTQFAGPSPWTLQQMQNCLIRSINHILTVIGSRISNKKAGETQMDIINYHVGTRLQQLAQLHGVLFCLTQFINSLNNQKNQQIKPILFDLCKLFTINQMQRLGEPIVEGGFICPKKWSSLSTEKEKSLERLRPSVAGLLDSFGVPDKYIRSQLAYGNPYQNYLDRAKQYHLNHNVSESGKYIMKSVPEMLKNIKPNL